MEHTEAVASQAVEKYVLREMTEEEALEFEQHFFTCKECADDVTAESVFADTARAVFADSKPIASEAERKSSFWDQIRAFFSVFMRPAALACASVVLAVITAYQGLVLIPSCATGGGRARPSSCLHIT